jgi:hypothetical protein
MVGKRRALNLHTSTSYEFILADLLGYAHQQYVPSNEFILVQVRTTCTSLVLVATWG